MKNNIYVTKIIKKMGVKLKNLLISKEILPRVLMVVFVSVLSIGIGICMGGNEQSAELSDSADVIDYSSISNKSSGWGLRKVKGSEPEVTDTQKSDLEQYNAFYMDNTRPKKLYLTFDEGYENGYTSVILDTLKEKQVTAAFFITGPYAQNQQELVRRMIDEGHIVGNHTVNHPNLPKLETSQAMINELTEMNELVKTMYDYDMKYMRPPEGEYSKRVLAVSRDLGFRTVFWSFAYKDWDVDSQSGRDYAFNQVTQYLHDGAVLLLHAVSSDNAQALGDIIDYARAQGYEFASLDEVPDTNLQ
ncbi:MAG: polysaccharide deacetylase family protein [Clostridia bacterium]|nr:polysaccharide deacetylase family protein [Clostridia bacterium]